MELQRTYDLNVAATTQLITPCALKEALPMTPPANRTVVEGRETIKRILRREDTRLLVIVGPCSIHDHAAALDYAGRLAKLRETVEDQLFLVMRTYFEKPRTTLGWKGLVNDPHLDGTYDMATGLYKAREILLAVSEMGMPGATEVLDPIVPQYLDDLVAWAAIGARTTESQTHREMASGLSMPVGFKNSTDGNLRVAIDAMVSARQPHHFLGIDQEGRTAVISTRGNSCGHVIMRGGFDHPNYDPVSVTMAEEQMREAGLAPQIMIDCGHANSDKRPRLQAHVLKSALQQRFDGNTSIIGVMIESNIKEGKQPLASDPSKLEYGLSITDPCLSWEDTARLLKFARDELASGIHAGQLRGSF
jgi:3-deoxy-7-phosphoheptulonate synthase